MPSSSALCLILPLLAAPVLALDWPEFRGPDGQGHAQVRTAPIQWNATSNVVWRMTIPGSGWSSPVLRSGRLYLTTAVPGEGGSRSLRVLCLNAGDGSTRWDAEALTEPAGAPGIHEKNGHASATPVIGEDRVFAHFGHQGTACLDLQGRVIWRQTSLGYTPVHGNGSSPVRVDGLLVFSADGAENPAIVALTAATGEVRWKTPRDAAAKRKFSFCTPLVIEVAGRRQIISPASGAVCAYDPADGHELWRVNYGEGYSVVPRPVFAQGLLFLATGFDHPSIYAIRPDGSGDVTQTHVVWKVAKGAPNTPSLLSVGDEIYAISDGGVASCIDARTGTINWSERLGGEFSASPVHAAGRLYFQAENGTGFVVEPGKAYHLIARNELDERTLASYAVDEGAFFIRTESHLLRIGDGPMKK